MELVRSQKHRMLEKKILMKIKFCSYGIELVKKKDDKTKMLRSKTKIIFSCTITVNKNQSILNKN